MSKVGKYNDCNVVRVNDQRIDELESVLLHEFPSVECPLVHMFTRGMYIRQITMPKDSLVTSKIHKTQHPFTVSKGKCLVSTGSGDWVEITAPYTGITKPGTRRVVQVLEETVWTTYHQYNTITGDENDLPEVEKIKIAERIEGRIIKKRENKLISGRKAICHS